MKYCVFILKEEEEGEKTPTFLLPSWIAAAAAFPPLPPTTNTISIACLEMDCTIFAMSAPPREVPRIVPP